MNTTLMNPLKAVTLITLGLAIAAMGVYVAEADDAPGAAGFGLLLMIAGVVLGVRAARNRLPKWAARTAIAVGIVAAAFAAFLTHAVTVTAVLFPQPQDVPSVASQAPPPQYAAAVERARETVRAAVLEQNLPGVSVAVGADGILVWAEGFGWRDVTTETPVTPDTRFNIGTAASTILPAAASLGLANTGSEAPRPWSPEDIGGEGEDFPPLAILRHVIFQPLGLMSNDYPLAGERATHYVPRFADNSPTRRGRRLMYVFDLACCPDKMASYSTPSDLVRVGLATNPGSVNGSLAGGTVMSLITGRDGAVVAVTSNMAPANTAELAQRVADAFVAPAR